MSDKTRVCLTVADRRIVILESEKGISARKLAIMFKCGKTQVNNIIKNKGDILREWEENKHIGMKRKRKCKYGQLNDFVYEWFKCARAKHLPVSGRILQEVARQQAKYLNLDFTGSNGWLENFRKKHNISFRTICGGGDVSARTVEEWKNKLSYVFATYEPKDIYNVDETGIFYKTIPSMFLASTNEIKGKMIKDRITILFCCNSFGNKEPPLVIGRSQTPRCFNNVDMDVLEIKWYANKKAWMTSAIFEEWLDEFNSKMLKQNRHVILLLDKVPCHPEIQFSNVNLLFLPPEMSHLQPLNQGIIQSFKLHYRKRVLRSLLARTNDAEGMSEFIKKFNVGDAASWIKLSWNALKADTIQQCFRKRANACSESAPQIDPEGQLEELQHLAAAMGIIYDIRADLEDIPCFDNLEGDWESRLQEDYREEIISGETESDEECNTLEYLETTYTAGVKQEKVSCFDDFGGGGKSRLQEDGRRNGDGGEMIPEEAESDRLQQLETVFVAEVKQEVSCFDDFGGEEGSRLQEGGREITSEETESDQESNTHKDLALSAKTDYIAEIKQEEISFYDDFVDNSDGRLQEDSQGICEKMACDRKNDGNDHQTPLSLKEGISVLRKVQPLCRVLDEQYGENTTAELNKLLESFETCIVKESCKLSKQTT